MAEPNFVEQYPRPAGLVLLLITGYLLYDGLILPMIQIRNNAPNVTFSTENEFFVGIFGVPTALALIIGGDKFSLYMANLKAKHGVKPFYILGAVLGLAIFGLHMAFEHYLNNLGYHVIQSSSMSN